NPPADYVQTMIGTKLAHYEITAHLGSGGMGDVYQATDTKLGRSVAIKFLTEAFSHDVDRVARFQREARVLASLNHPGIAAIYGLEEINERYFLVMELVPGETLAERIKRGALPIEEALLIARQIAEALEEAHEKGIIHRDLKPANIKVTPEGKVKVLDFGLAKAYEREQTNAALSNSPTISMAATNAGMILGTAAYMSPEQARGKQVDRRMDIWAFGCVLYEMLTSKQAFAGDDLTDVLASVVKTDPAIEALQPNTPVAIRTLLPRCMDKNIKRRMQHIGEARIILEDVLSGALTDEAREAAPAQAQARPIWREMSAWSLAAILAVLAGLAFWRPWASAPVAPVVTRFTLAVPKNQTLNYGKGGLAISPDGRYGAYSATPAGGTRQLFLRAMDRSEVAPIPGTDNASGLFFSPDSQWLAFTANNKLKKVPVAGGTPITLCDPSAFNTGSWAADGTIYYFLADTVGLTNNQTGKLMRVPA